MSMYGNEIARVHAHENGYTVETKTKPRKPSKNKDGTNAVPYSSDSGDTMPNHEWESSVAKSKQDVLDLVGKAHAAHADSKMRGQFRKLNEKK
jgi:hypothetical protein